MTALIAQNWYTSTLIATIADGPVLKDINIDATLEIWKSEDFDGICLGRDQELGTVPGLRQGLLAQYNLEAARCRGRDQSRA